MSKSTRKATFRDGIAAMKVIRNGRTAKIQEIVAKTVDAYSVDRFGEHEWVRCISYLLSLSFKMREIEAILFSTHMRHLADIAGEATAMALQKYMRSPATSHYFSTNSVEALACAMDN